MDWLGEKGFDPVYGARPLKRVIQTEVLNPLARMLLERKVNAGDEVAVKLKGAGLVLSTRGSSGGYRLARAPEEIALIDILRVVDGYGVTSEERSAPAAPVLAQVWEQIRASETELLSGTSIANLLERANTHDWVI